MNYTYSHPYPEDVHEHHDPSYDTWTQCTPEHYLEEYAHEYDDNSYTHTQEFYDRIRRHQEDVCVFMEQFSLLIEAITEKVVAEQSVKPMRNLEECGLGTISDGNLTDSYENFGDSETDEDEEELQESFSDIDPSSSVCLLETPSLDLTSCVEMTQEEPFDAWLADFNFYDLHTETSKEKASPMDVHSQEVELEPLSTSCESHSPFIESLLIPLSPTYCEALSSELDDHWHVQWDESDDEFAIEDEEESVSIVHSSQLEQGYEEVINACEGVVSKCENPIVVELTHEERDFLDSSTVESFNSFLESEWSDELDIQCPFLVSSPNLFAQEMDTKEGHSFPLLGEPNFAYETNHWSLTLEKLALVEVEHIDFLGVNAFDVVNRPDLIDLINNLKINLVRNVHLAELKFLKRIRHMIYSKYLILWHGRIQYLSKFLGCIGLFILILIEAMLNVRMSCLVECASISIVQLHLFLSILACYI